VSSAPRPPSEAEVHALPKVELHCHLDGAVRPATLLELAREASIPLPADTVEELLPYVRVAPDCRSLRDFLHTFETFYPVLVAPGAMRRAACELLEDAAADGVLHLEVRFCPALQQTERQSAEEVVGQVLAGLDEGGRATGVGWGVILCAYRPLPLAVNEHVVDFALSHADRGVVGVDLAGPEDLPGAPFAEAFARAREGGLPVTIHAGEAAGPESVREAVDVLGASRLGHGVALKEDAELASRVRETGVVLECCLTSNLQTGAVPSLADHPFDAFRRAGQRVTLSTDDPSVCGTRMTDELLLAARTWGYDLDDLRGLTADAAEGAFLDADRRRVLRARLAD